MAKGGARIRVGGWREGERAKQRAERGLPPDLALRIRRVELIADCLATAVAHDFLRGDIAPDYAELRSRVATLGEALNDWEMQ